MTERLLQFIWQLQYFNRSQLMTADGDLLTILHPGTLNTNQGPDFLDAKIRTGNTTWAGSIELHLFSSDWTNHGHSHDENYRNVILHVVWIDDVKLDLPFPVLELQSKVPNLLLVKFDELMKGRAFIPCESMVQQVAPLVWISWKERLLVERLQKKSILISDYLAKNNNHWEETFWWLLSRNFGFTVNGEAFEKIARSIPLNILSRHKNQLHQTEALLFGQAGLLDNDFNEAYPGLLQKEYRFLKNKYQLQGVKMSLYFLRMRPSNFPTIRLAQLAMLVHTSSHLFSSVKETVLLSQVKKLLSVTANDYWHYHYVFDEPAAFKEKKLGAQMMDSIIINTIVPILFAFGHYHNEQRYKDKALAWLQQMAAEKNAITNGFARLGIHNKTAFDSQALIALKNDFCNQKRCLDCAVGNRVLKPVVAIP